MLDLDPVTQRKLKVLKRVVGPGKSTAELLAILREREGREEEAKSDKKRWWKRG
jgi:hypothetical protein